MASFVQPSERSAYSSVSRALLTTIGVAMAAMGCALDDNGEIEITGQIEGTTVEPGSRVGGRVSEVLVAEGDVVAEEDVLIRLESTEAEAAMAAARSRLREAEATLQKLKEGPRPEQIRRAKAAAARTEANYLKALEGARSQEIGAARAAAEAAAATRDEARTDFQRIEKLYEGDAISKAQYDQARHRFEATQKQYERALEELNLLVSGTRNEDIAAAKAALDEAQAVLDELENGTREEDIEVAMAVRDLAEAEVRRAQVTLDEMTIRSPWNGVVETIDIHPGDILAPGPALSIIDPNRLELTVYVTADTLGHLAVGEQMDFTTDSHGDERFTGTIVRIANQGEFTPRNLQTEQERVQQVFGVLLHMDSANGKLRPGMTAIARLAKPQSADSALPEAP